MGNYGIKAHAAIHAISSIGENGSEHVGGGRAAAKGCGEVVVWSSVRRAVPKAV